MVVYIVIEIIMIMKVTDASNGEFKGIRLQNTRVVQSYE